MLIQYGATANFVVSYDSTFTGGSQPDGPGLAQGVLDYCEYDLTRLSLLFGGILPPAASLPIRINLIPGLGGASNNGSNLIDCKCNLNTTPEGLPALVVAEEAEIFMVLQNRGWIAGWSNGEALSRVLAGVLYPNRAWLFSAGQGWLNSARPDWVTAVDHTDGNSLSYGCGTLFLTWLADQLGHSWPAIVQAGAPNTSTLAETAGLLGVANPWQSFSSLIAADLPPGSNLPSHPTELGQPSEPTDDPYPLAPPAGVPALYMRHNLADDGTSHTGSLSDSPDIIVRNNPVANPQATFSTPASIVSDAESDPYVAVGQANYVYLRAWNRGADAPNTFATVYWSPPSTLVSPDLWTLIGSSYYPDVPPGSVVQASNPGVVWPADKIPAAGHYCFVAMIGNAASPPPDPSSFATFDDYMNYIFANNNITWRNFNVGLQLGPLPPWWRFRQLPVLVAGAWDKARPFAIEVEAELPDESCLALNVPHWLGRAAKPGHGVVEEMEDFEREPAERRRLLVPLPVKGRHLLGEIELPRGARAWSRLLVELPDAGAKEPYRVVIRQLYRSREVGRITWQATHRRLNEA